jgi:hypothetical protein
LGHFFDDLLRRQVGHTATDGLIAAYGYISVDFLRVDESGIAGCDAQLFFFGHGYTPSLVVSFSLQTRLDDGSSICHRSLQTALTEPG